jgi:hypothetical protein
LESRIGFERNFDGTASETDVHLWTPAALGTLYNSDEYSGSHSHEISLVNEADEQMSRLIALNIYLQWATRTIENIYSLSTTHETNGRFGLHATVFFIRSQP